MWDFGGQEIMHATHQFFLTRRSVYLVVLDARQGEEQNRIEYWLKLVNSLSGGSPVILVGNKCEGLRLDIDQRGLRAKYPNIVAILETSCVDNVGLHALKTTLAKTVATLSHVRDVLPRSFFEVKEILERLGADYLPFNEYEGLCVKHGVSTARARELLIGFLHDLGTVLCFRDDPRLRDTNILNPEWVTGGVYRILNSNRAAVQKGLLRWPDLDAILESGKYPADKRGFIVEMMKKFELCYESDGIFLVPDLLTKEEPDTGSWDDALHFVVKYDVLPSSVIGRLIVRMHQVISRGTVWRTGVVLTFDRNRALVKTDREDGLLTIMVSGAIRGRRGLLTAIRTQLRSIEQTIPGLTCEERVPVSGHGGIWVPYSHLLRLEEAGKRTVVPHGLVDEFEIRELLDGIESRNDRILVRRSSASPASAFDGADEAERADEAVGRSVDDGGEVDGEVDGRAWTPRQAIGLGILCSGILAVAIAAYAIVSRFTDSGVAIAAGAFALAVIAVIAVVVLRTSGRISESTYGLGLKQALSTFGATSRGDRDEDRQ
jgi:internalin A